MNRLRILDLPADRMEGEAVVAFFFADDRPLRGPAALLDWRLNGFLADLLRRGELAGMVGERVVTHNNGKLGGEWVLFAGGGLWGELDRAGYQQLIRDLLASCREAGFARIALLLAPLQGMAVEEVERMVRQALEDLPEGGMECLLSVGSRERQRELPRAT